MPGGRATWHPLDPHELVLRGYDGAQLKSTVCDYLYDEESRRVMALAVNVDLACELRGINTLSNVTTGYYGDPAVLQQLATLRLLGRGEVHFGSEYVRWTMKPVEKGSRDELLVDVIATTFIYVKRKRDFPWPQDVSEWLDRHNDAAGACVRFAFLTSRIAEPWLEEFYQQVVALNDCLSQIEADRRAT